MRISTSVIASVFLFLIFLHPTKATIEGFYCDVFQDEGTQISGGNLEVDCEYIDFSQEHLNTSSNETEQNKIMIENNNDDNGYLLYPDGEPRFAIIYYHGGYMGHASDLGTEGRQRVRDHYYHGGSQFGSCAGSYMLSTYWQGGQLQSTWFQLWPGEMDGPNVSSTSVDKIINAGSPFIGYHGYEEVDEISGVYHQNGGSVDTNDAPDGTEFCAMHNSSSLRGYAAVWTWKDNDTTGRVLGHTGHPEGNSSEDKKKYISASMLLLADGLGKPGIKHTLESGQTITMDKETADNDPLFTKIGDKQYHHFLLDCEEAKNVNIEVVGEDGFDFHLFAAKDTFAFRQDALYADTADGNSKTLMIPSLEKGTWHVGVKLYTTVTTTSSSIFPTYGGPLEVLNGISYTVKAEWEAVGIYKMTKAQIRKQLSINIMNNKNVRINIGKLPVKNLQIYTMQGKLCWKTKTSEATKQYIWQPKSAGMYVVRLGLEKDIYTQRLTIVK